MEIVEDFQLRVGLGKRVVRGIKPTALSQCRGLGKSVAGQKVQASKPSLGSS